MRNTHLLTSLGCSALVAVSALLLVTAMPSQAVPTKAAPSQPCEQSASQLTADYQIEIRNGDKITQTRLRLWREHNKVAHQYPATQITEQWDLLRNKQIKPTRFFDHEQRAIEYQPGEKVHGKQEHDWSQRYQLISASQLADFSLQSSEGEGCDQRQTLTLSRDQQTLTLIWLPQLQLIESLQRQQGDTREQWQLMSLDHDQQKIGQFFATRQDYQTTDFADIGDNHSDPFLTQMVTQGFIEGGASGFYDVHGKPLAGTEHGH